MTYLLKDIADEIHRELDSPSDIAVGVIFYWLRANLGAVNSFIRTSYTVDSSTSEVIPAVDEDEKAIFKKLYNVYYYDKKIRSILGAAGTEVVVEIDSDGSKIRRVNKTEIGKTYAQLKSAEFAELNKLVTAYNTSKTRPLQVAGDDTIEGVYNPSGPEHRNI